MNESGGAVDKRIVQMEFQNEQFEKGVKQSIKSLEDLKNALKIDDTAASLKNIENSLSSVQETVNRTSSALASLEGYATKAFSPIERFIQRTKDAIIQWPAEQLVGVFNSTFVKPLRDGMDEYEEKMSKVQTLTNAVKWNEFGGDASKASEAVTASLDRLNSYADKTIYSFKDMTTAFTKFVQQSDLKTAEDSIVGLYNAAAYFGLNKQQGSMVSYNMAQALGKGQMDLIDWKSFELATMGGVDSKETIIAIGKAMGRLTEYGNIVGATGKKAKKFVVDQQSFRESLQYDWFDKDVMNAWMQLYSGTLPEDLAEKLTAMGIPVKQIAVDAAKAASEIKSFGQLWDTVGEALGTGWASTFEIMFGDLETIKTRLTTVGTTLQDIIEKATEKRNRLLRNWLGTPEEIEDSYKRHFKFLTGMSSEISNVYTANKNKRTGTTQKSQLTSGKIVNVEDHVVTNERKGIQHITNAFTNLSEAAKAAAEGVGSVFDAIGDGLDFGLGGEDGMFKTLAANLGFTPESIDFFTENIANGMKAFRDAVKSDGVFTRNGVDWEKRGYGRKPVSDGHLVGEKEETAFANIFDIASAIGSVIGLIQQGIGFILTNVGKIASIVMPLVGGVMNIASAIGVAVTSIGRSLIELKVFDALSTALQPVYAMAGWIVSLISKGLNGIAELIYIIASGNTIKKVFSVFEAIGKAVNEIVTAGKNWLKNLWTTSKASETLTKAWEKLKGFGTKIRDTLFPKQKDGKGSIWDIAIAKITELKTKVLKSTTLKKLGKSISDTFNKALSKVPGLVDKITGLLPSLQKGFSFIKGVLKGLFSVVLGVGMVAFSGLFYVLKGIWKVGSTVFGKFASWAKNLWETSHASEKLSKAWEKLKGYGKKIRDALFPKPKEGEKSAWDSVLAKAKEVKNKIVSSELFQKIKGKLESGFNSFLNNLPGYMDSIYNWVAKMYHSIQDAFGEDKFLGKVLAKIKQIPAKISEAWNVIKSSFSNFFKPIEGEDKMTLFERIGARLQALNPILEWVGQQVEKFVGLILNLISPAAAAETEEGGISESVEAVADEGVASAEAVATKGEEAKSKFEGVITFFESLKEKLKSIRDKIDSLLPEGVTVSSLLQKVKDVFKEMDVNGVIGVVGALVGVRGLFKLGGTVGKLGGMFKRIGKGFELFGKGSESWFHTGNLLNLTPFKDAAEIFSKNAGGGLNALLTQTPKSLVKGMKEWRKAQTAGKTFKAVGAMMLEFAVAIGIIVGVLFALSKLSNKDLIRGGIIILAISAFLGIVAIVANRIGKGSSFGKSLNTANGFIEMLTAFAAIALAVIGIIVILKVLGSMDPQKLIQGIVGLGAVLLELAIFSRLMSKGNKFGSTGNAMKGIFGLAVGLLALVGVISLLSMMPLEQMGKGLLGLGAILLELVVFSHLISKSGAKGSLGFVGLGIGLLALMPVFEWIAHMKWENLLAGLKGMGLILLELAAFTRLTKKFKASSGAGLLLLAVALAAIVGVMRLLVGFNAQDLTKGLKAMGILMLELGVFMKLSGAGSGGAKSALNNITGAILIVTALFGFVTALRMVADLPTDKITGFGVSMGAILAGFAAMLFVLNKMGPLGGMSAAGALAGFTFIAGAFAMFLGALDELLESLGVDMTASIARGAEVMEEIGNFLGSFAHGLIKGIVGDVSLESFGTDLNKLLDGIKTFASSSNDIDEGGLTKGVGAITKLGEATMALPKQGLIPAILGTVNVNSFGTGLSSIATGISQFVSVMKDTTYEEIESAAGALRTLGTATQNIPEISALGVLVTGITDYDGFSKNLPRLGLALAGFALETSAVGNWNAVGNGATALNDLARATQNIPTIGGLVNLITGITDYNTFIDRLPKMGRALRGFSAGMGLLEKSNLMLGVGAIKILAEASASLPDTGGFLQRIVGEKGYDKFSTALPALGGGLAGLSDSLQDKTIDLDKINVVGEAIKILAEASKHIYGTDGVIQRIFGEKDMGQFAGNMPAVGQGLTGLCWNLGEAFDKDKVKAAAEGLAGMAEAAKHIYGEGGFLQKLFGEKDIAKFSGNMPKVAEGLTSMCWYLGDAFNIEKVKSAALALAYLGVAAQKIPGEGGLWQAIFGEKSMGNFASNMEALGKGLAQLTTQIGNNEIQPDIFDGIIGILTKFSLYDFTTGTDKMVNSAGHLMTFGQRMKQATDYYKGVDLNGLEQTISIYGMLIRMLTDMSNADVDWLDLESVKQGLDNIFASMSMISNDPTAFENIGKMGAAFLNGFTQVATPEVMGKSATDAITQFTTIFESDGRIKIAGGKVATDLVAGITAGTTEVTTAAGKLGTDLIVALQQSLDYANRHDDVAANLEKTLDQTKKVVENVTVDAPDQSSFDAAVQGAIDIFNNLGGEEKGGNFITAIMSGMRGKIDELTGASNETADTISNPIQNLIDSALGWGSNITQGLANGLVDSDALGSLQSSVNTINSTIKGGITGTKGMDLGSPSHLTYKYGMFVVQGLANGLSDYAYLTSDATTDMIDKAKDNLVSGLNDYSTLLAMDMNPNPVIRPVLDLSELRAQSSLVGSMFDTVRLDAGISRDNSLLQMLERNSRDEVSGVNPEIYSAVLRLEDKLAMLGERIEGMQVSLDGGALVGSIATQMDRTLSNRATMAGRGN